MLRMPGLSRKHTLLQEYKERIFVLTSRIEEEKNKQRQLRYTPAPEAWDAQICCVGVTSGLGVRARVDEAWRVRGHE